MNLLADMRPHRLPGRWVVQITLPSNLQLLPHPLRITQIVDNHLVLLGTAGVLLQLFFLSFAESLAPGDFYQHVYPPLVFGAHKGIIRETAIYPLEREDFFESTPSLE